MTPKDMGKATLGQLGNGYISSSKCGIRVCTFMHSRVEAEMQYTPLAR